MADRYTEQAALAAVGALDGRELEEFRTHADGCEACRREMDAFERTAALLPQGLPPVAPRPSARARLLDAAGGDAARARVTPLGRPRRLFRVSRGQRATLAAAALVLVALGVALVWSLTELTRARQEIAARDRRLATLEDRAAQLAAIGTAQTRTARALSVQLADARLQADRIARRLGEGSARLALSTRALQTELAEARAAARRVPSLERNVTALETRLASAEAEVRERSTQLLKLGALTTLLGDSAAQVARLAPQGAFPAADVRVVWSPERQLAFLVGSELRPAPADSVYELWAIGPPGTAPVPAGTFQVGSERIGLNETPVAEPNVQVFAVTIEPRGGSAQPTTPIVLLGKSRK